jgi:type VI secretion system protein ImpC
MADPNVLQPAAGAPAVEVNAFDDLLKKEFKPKSSEAEVAVERAVRTLAEQALAETSLISTDVIESIKSMIAKLDQKLT